MAEFNLIDEPWIPSITLDGKSAELGIRDVLLKAHTLREICDDSPLVTVAIHRLLLAILYRAFQGPSGMSEWKALYAAGSFAGNSVLATYLEKWRDRFWLFHEHHPFMQVAGLDLNKYNKDGTVKLTKGKNESLDGMMRLAKEAPDIGGRVLFDHRVGTEHPEYSPKDIAKMILSCQSFAGTGIPSSGQVNGTAINPYKPFPNNPDKKVGCAAAPCVDGLILWLQGDNLFHTLMLNLVPYEFCPNDLPPWEDGHIVESAINSWTVSTGFTGPCQRFAPLSRFIKAIDRGSILFTNGLKVAADAGDQMKAYYREGANKPYVAAKLLKHKAAWRDAHTLMAVGRSNHKPPECLNLAARLANSAVSGHTVKAHVVGMATNKDKALLWRHERMPVPVALLEDANLLERLGGLLQYAEQGASHQWSRTNRMATLFLSPTAEDPDGRKPDPKDVEKMVQDLDPRPAYWARLEKHFFELLEHLPEDWDAGAGKWKPDDQQAATRAWHEAVKREAKRALVESIRSLGTTARAIAAVARVRITFSDDDLKPQSPNGAASKRKKKPAGKGGRKK